MRMLVPLLLVGTMLAAAGTGAGGSPCRWRVVPGTPAAELTGVAAVADDDVWAVGSDAGGGVVLHWDGRGWRRTAWAGSPLDLAAVTARDIWLVGASSLDVPAARPRSAYWDGRRWRRVPVPGRLGTYLRDVAGSSARDAWAVGAGPTGPLVAHWNGRGWTSSAAGPPHGLLQAIDLPWAVGTQGETGPTSSEDPLVMRLRAGRWQTVSAPSLDSVDENLLAVDAVAPGDVWAVGSADVLGGRSPLVQRLDGGVWRDESIQGLPAARAALLSVVAFGPSDAWVAGYRGFTAEHTLLAHWDGRRWTQVPGRPGSLSDLSAPSPHDIWAVGSNGARSLVERYTCG